MKNGLFKKWLTAALCVLALGSTAALAEPDTFYLGTGRNGSLTVSASGTSVNIYAQVKATLTPGTRTIPVGSTPGFAPGDLIMVLQSTGIETVPASGDASEISLNGSQVGRWELARLEGVSGTTLTLTAPLVYGYAINVTQVIRVREYTDVTIEGTGSIVAQPWDPLTATGGVVAFLSQGAVTNHGVISATGSGFRGGTFVNDGGGKLGCTGLDEVGPSGALKGEGIANTRYGAGNTGRGNVANAGGGGICLKSGGGGGGNGGAGGLGGDSSSVDTGGVSRPVGGMGGAKLAFNYDLFHRLTFGGGGGAGHGTLNSPSVGGAGGGIVFIRARALTGAAGVISAAGDSGTLSNSDASSGGGGGGSIYLRLAETVSCGEINVAGGSGGSTNASRVGPGGGGGGGRLLFQAQGTSCINEDSYDGARPGTQRATTVPGPFGAQSGGPGVFHQLPGGFAVPPAPVVSSPVGIINQRRPDIRGTAEPTPEPTAPRTRVIIYIDGVEVGSVEADASGAYVFPMPTDLSDGDHTVQAVAEHYGVRSSRSELKTFTVDTKAPIPEIDSGPPLLGNSRDVTFDLDVKEPDTGVTYQCRLVPVPPPTTGSPFTDCTDPADFTVPADGTYTLEVLARDAAGNVSDTPATYTFTVDTLAPDTTISGPTSPTNSTTALFDFGVDEPGVSYECSLDGATFTSCTDPSIFTGLGHGEHTLLVRATDPAGNTDPTPASFTWTVDITAPDTTIVSGPAPLGNSTDAPFDFGVEVPEEGVTYECNLDGAGFTSCTDPVIFTDLGHGEHTLEVRARDALDNVDTTPATYRWTVDTLAPAAPSVLSPESGGTVTTSTPVITGSAEPHSTVTVIIDGTEVGTVRTDADGNWSYTPTTPLAEGPHDVRARATDEAGNSSPTTGSRTFTVADTTVPETSITSGPSGTTPERTATFELGSSEPGVTYECSLDGAEYTACTSPVTFTDLADGEHTLRVRARDAAGNVDDSPAGRTWTVSGGTEGGDIAFLGDGLGCSATGGDASLVLMGLGTFLTLARRRRRN